MAVSVWAEADMVTPNRKETVMVDLKYMIMNFIDGKLLIKNAQ